MSPLKALFWQCFFCLACALILFFVANRVLAGIPYLPAQDQGTLIYSDATFALYGQEYTVQGQGRAVSFDGSERMRVWRTDRTDTSGDRYVHNSTLGRWIESVARRSRAMHALQIALLCFLVGRLIRVIGAWAGNHRVWRFLLVAGLLILLSVPFIISKDHAGHDSVFSMPALPGIVFDDFLQGGTRVNGSAYSAGSLQTFARSSRLLLVVCGVGIWLGCSQFWLTPRNRPKRKAHDKIAVDEI